MQLSSRTTPNGQWKYFRGITMTLLILGIIHIVAGFIAISITVGGCKRFMRHSFDELMNEEENMMENPKTRMPHMAAFMSPRHMEEGQAVCILPIVNGVIIAAAMLVIITGALGYGAFRSNISHRKSGLKTGFLVMSIINTLSVAPTLLMLTCTQSIIIFMVGEELGIAGVHALNVVQGIGAFGVFLLSIIGSAFACCCTPPEVEDTAVTIVHMNNPAHQIVSALTTPSYDNYDKNKLMLNDQLDYDVRA